MHGLWGKSGWFRIIKNLLFYKLNVFLQFIKFFFFFFDSKLILNIIFLFKKFQIWIFSYGLREEGKLLQIVSVESFNFSFNFRATPTVVLPGGGSLTDNSVKKHKISDVLIHPDYDPKQAYNDIALLRLKETIVWVENAHI